MSIRIKLDDNEVTFDFICEKRSEKVDLIPNKLIKQIIISPICLKKEQDAKSICALIHPHIIEKGIADLGLLVFIILSNYVDQLPLYRQEQVFNLRYTLKITINNDHSFLGLKKCFCKELKNIQK